MASTYLSRTPSSSSNRRTWTWSAWVKRSSLGTGNQVLFQGIDGGFPEKIQFTGSDILEYDHDIAGTDYTVYVDRRFRDVNSWYHIVVAKDTTQSTETNRIKIYVNGEQQSLSEYQLGYPGQNYEGAINKNVVHNIGANNSSSSEVFDGYMSHVHFCDGSALAPTVFGSTDSTTGEWKINTSPSFTPGTNGFTILKDGNTITDQSANSNNFTLSGGTLTKSEDNPSNVFATYNAAFNASGHTLSRGNTQATVSGSSWIWRPSTLGATTGKYYAEIRVSSAGGGTSIVGITNIDDCTGYAPSDTHFGKSAVNSGTLGFAWYSDDGKIYYPPNASTSVYGTWGASDILMLAMDLDNGAFYIGKNGSWLNSGNPASGSSRTGAVRTWTAGTGTWVFADAIANGSVLQWNWGNGYFGQSNAVASAGTNASGNGIFEYDVPTGYTALSTKGLNT